MNATLNVPNSIVAGDRIIWFTDPMDGTNLDTGLPIIIAPPAFTLGFAFRGAGYLDITATDDGGGRFKSVISTDDSANLESGTLSWQGYVTDSSGDRTTVGAGQTLVIVNLSLSQNAPQSSVQKLQAQLDKVNAAIDSLIAGKPIQEYEINGRKLKYLPLPDLIALRDTLNKELYRAQSAALKTAGKNRRRNYIQFNSSGGKP